MSKKRIIKDKKTQKTMAINRINKLFKSAEQKALVDNFDLANRYVTIARKISMRYRISIPKEHRNKFCKKCNSFLLPYKTCRIRISRNKIIVFCKNCETYSRIPIKNHS